MIFCKTDKKMKLVQKMILVTKIILFGCVIASTSLYADVLPMPLSSNVSESADIPRLGLDMEKVEAQFGEPNQRLDAIGEPPITRWIYPTFTVFFEHDKVLHSVIHRS